MNDYYKKLLSQIDHNEYYDYLEIGDIAVSIGDEMSCEEIYNALFVRNNDDLYVIINKGLSHPIRIFSTVSIESNINANLICDVAKIHYEGDDFNWHYLNTERVDCNKNFKFNNSIKVLSTTRNISEVELRQFFPMLKIVFHADKFNITGIKNLIIIQRFYEGYSRVIIVHKSNKCTKLFKTRFDILYNIDNFIYFGSFEKITSHELLAII
jgi:hypothetical protein